MSAQIVDRIGVWAFAIMTALIFVCITFGFIAVYQASQEDKTRKYEMTVTMGDELGDIDPIIEEAFEEFMKEYQLDLEGSLEDLLFDMFAAGFEIALELQVDEEE